MLQILGAVVKVKKAEADHQSLVSDTDEKQRAEIEPALRDSWGRVEEARFQLNLLRRLPFVQEYSRIQMEAQKRLNKALERQFQVHNSRQSTDQGRENAKREVAEALEGMLGIGEVPEQPDEFSDRLWQLVDQLV